MSKFKFITFLPILLIVLATGCKSEVKTNVEPLPTPQSTSTSVEEAENNEKTATGIYTGQIDNNSIEIKLDGLPEDKAFMAFAFSEKARSEFEKAQLQSNTRVKIKYVEREGRQALLLEIAKVS